MSTEQLTAEVLALPLSKQASLAQTLWENIHNGLQTTDDEMAVMEAIRRDAEMTSGTVAGRPHGEVMQAARRALRCT